MSIDPESSSSTTTFCVASAIGAIAIVMRSARKSMDETSLIDWGRIVGRDITCRRPTEAGALAVAFVLSAKKQNRIR